VSPELTALCAEIDASQGEEDEWVPTNSRHSLEIWPTRSIRRIVFTTKGWWTRDLCGEDALEGVLLLERAGVVDDTIGAIVRREADAAGLGVAFVGDLDPVDLVTLLSLEDALGDRLELCGVGTRWMREGLSLSDRPDPLLAARITMDDFERRVLALIERHVPERAARWYGDALSFLRDGRKLELEGASNPGIHGEATARWCRDAICGRMPDGRVVP
jgi:hypothetical protein